MDREVKHNVYWDYAVGNERGVLFGRVGASAPKWLKACPVGEVQSEWQGNVGEEVDFTNVNLGEDVQCEQLRVHDPWVIKNGLDCRWEGHL